MSKRIKKSMTASEIVKIAIEEDWYMSRLVKHLVKRGVAPHLVFLHAENLQHFKEHGIVVDYKSNVINTPTNQGKQP
jgi:hypothetical protein